MVDSMEIRAYRVNSRFPRNGREAPTRPVSCWYMRYASRRWSGDKGPFSPRRAWTARAVDRSDQTMIYDIVILQKGELPTFLHDLPNEDLGKPSHDLRHGHGYLLTEALLNYLPRRRVRT